MKLIKTWAADELSKSAMMDWNAGARVLGAGDY